MDKYHQGATDFSDEIVELEKVAKRQKATLEMISNTCCSPQRKCCYCFRQPMNG